MENRQTVAHEVISHEKKKETGYLIFIIVSFITFIASLFYLHVPFFVIPLIIILLSLTATLGLMALEIWQVKNRSIPETILASIFSFITVVLAQLLFFMIALSANAGNGLAM